MGKTEAQGFARGPFPSVWLHFVALLRKDGAGKRQIVRKPVEINNFHPSWEEFSNSQWAEEISVLQGLMQALLLKTHLEVICDS